ncbi:MAG: T6SS immunity protein Tli4 family protein [Pararobbsia sp.]
MPTRPSVQKANILAGTTMLTMKAAVGYDGVQKFIELTNDEYRNITQRDNWTVPTERGFCIDGALIGGPSRNSEGATQFIVLEAGQASWFMVKMRDAVNADMQSSLLKTLPNLRRELHTQGYNGSVRVLRKGKRQVAGMDAEEVLFSVKEGDIQLFRFYLLAPGNPDSTAQPHTEIELSLGEVLTDADKRSGMKPEELSSLLDDAGAIQVWDTLLNSMRLRPGAM